MSWGKKRIAGRDFDLGHLDPFSLQVTPKVEGATTYTVRVSFGCHTFTRDLQEGDKPDLHFNHNGETRCFCADRYGLSLDLPDLIRYAANGKVWFAERANFLIVEAVPQENAPYAVFFNMEKAKKEDGIDAAMFITSAYLKPNLPNRLSTITFATLVDYKVNGKPVHRPPDTRTVQPIKRR